MPCYRLVLSRYAGALSPVLLCVATLLAAGCRPAPSITTFTEKAVVDDEDDALEPEMPEPASNGERILGAFVPGPAVPGGARGWWVFKLRGRPETVGKRAADFDRFLASLRLPTATGALPAWQLPKRWRTVPAADKISILNLRTSHPLTPVDFTFSSVGGTLLENVNRWEAQVGLPPSAEADLPKLWKQDLKTADGHPVYRLDIKGPGGKNQMMVPPFAKS